MPVNLPKFDGYDEIKRKVGDAVGKLTDGKPDDFAALEAALAKARGAQPDGVLDADDVGALLAASGYTGENGYAAMAAILNKGMLGTLDTGKDGTINADEWRAGFLKYFGAEPAPAAPAPATPARPQGVRTPRSKS